MLNNDCAKGLEIGCLTLPILLQRKKESKFQFLFFFTCREPGAEQKFKDISNAYEVHFPVLYHCFHGKLV